MYPDQQEAAFEALRDAERAQSSLLRRFEALAALIPADAAEHHGVQSLLEGAKEDVAAQNLSTLWMLEFIPREFRRSPSAAPLAQKVFDTPELLERILFMCHTRTVFESHRVNKDWYSTIEGSRKLQQMLGLQPDPDAHLSLKANKYVGVLSGMRCHMTADPHVETEYGAALTVRLSACALEDTVKMPGSRLRQVQLTQPPIKHLNLQLSCCDSTYARAHRLINTSMHNDQGLTIGHMRDKVAQLTRAHRLCPNADMVDHGEDGIVTPRVSFSGELLLRDDDRRVVEKRAMDIEALSRDDREDAFQDRLRPNIRAKIAGKSEWLAFGIASMLTSGTAHRKWLRVPTLAEFDAEKERREQLEKQRQKQLQDVDSAW